MLNGGGPRPFRFCDMWRSHPNYIHIVREAWSIQLYGRPMYILVKKLKNVKTKLRKLHRQRYINLQERVLEAHQELVEAQEELSNNLFEEVCIENVARKKNEYQSLVKADTTMAAQRAKIEWLTKIDANTHYFHAKIKENSSRSRIIALETEDGGLCDERQYIENQFLDFYKGLFGTEILTQQLDQCLLTSLSLSWSTYHGN